MRNSQNPREVYGNVLLQLARANKKIVALDADLCKSTMTCKIEEELPEQYFEMGIGEQNMMSVAGGLSLTGQIPFVNSFAIFLTSRAFDQIRQAIGISGLNVKIIGSSAGLSDFGDGSTHQTLEDISIMRSVPGMTVIVPSDANELEGAIKAIAAYHGPVYLRYSRNNMPEINISPFNFTIGEVYSIHEGKDITVFCIGDMVAKTLNVAEELERDGIGVCVVNVPTIKPLNREKIVYYARKTAKAITVEEHSIIGGLGSAVAEALRLESIPIEFVGINDSYGKSAHSHQELLDEYGLTENHIKNTIYKMLKVNGK